MKSPSYLYRTSLRYVKKENKELMIYENGNNYGRSGTNGQNNEVTIDQS
jgi:hypothetical protein